MFRIALPRREHIKESDLAVLRRLERFYRQEYVWRQNPQAAACDVLAKMAGAMGYKYGLQRR